MTNFTTMEKLAMKQDAQYGATLRFGDKVIFTSYAWGKNHYCEVYEMIDDPDTMDCGEIEARLNLIASKDGFKDGGHAVQWGLAH